MDDEGLRKIREAQSEHRPDQQAKTEQQREMLDAALSQLLTGDARERLNRIRMVRADRAQQVEQLVMRMGQTGQLRQKVSEQELVQLLDQISHTQSSGGPVIYRRRDSDSDTLWESGAAGGAKLDNQAAEGDDDDDFFD